MWKVCIIILLCNIPVINGFNRFSSLINSYQSSSHLYHEKYKLYASDEDNIENNEPGRAFIFGLGYVGCAVAKTLTDDGWCVSGTCTNVQKIQNLRAKGVRAHLFDLQKSDLKNNDDYTKTKMMQVSDLLADLQTATHVLITVPPSESGDVVLEAVSVELKHAALNGNLKWIGYLSSTGVYGDCQGAWVTEDDNINLGNLKSGTAVRRLNAEMSWNSLNTRSGLRIHIFRLAGIYGPGRSALDTIRNYNGDMKQAGADDKVYISRIHVKDIVKILLLSMKNPQPGLLLNIADDLPSTRYDVLAYACKLLGYPIYPPSSTGSGKYQSRGGSKRVDNERLTEVLKSDNVKLLYEDYRKGLKSIFNNNDLDPRSLYNDEKISIESDQKNNNFEQKSKILTENQNSIQNSKYSNAEAINLINYNQQLEHRIEELEASVAFLAGMLTKMHTLSDLYYVDDGWKQVYENVNTHFDDAVSSYNVRNESSKLNKILFNKDD